MSASAKHDVAALNGLIETTLDSAHGYQEAAKDAKNPNFKQLFGSRATERHRIARELQALVRQLGEEPADDGTALAVAHRMFLNLKNTVTGSDQSVVDEVERGEDHIKAKFEDAINDNDLSPATRAAITNAYGSVKADHDKMRDIKHSLQASH